MKKFLKSSYMSFIILLLYTPILILIFFSFNKSDSMSIFYGFSNKWYKELSKDQSFLQSIIISIFTAIISTFLSIIIGTMAAIGISKTKKITQKMILYVTNIPLINADIITAISLMMLFITLWSNFGFFTLILSHISFVIPYIIITILPRLKKIDNSIIEASIDLGANSTKTLIKVVLPILKPSIITASAIAFAMSFDDFIISYFTGGDDINVATFIYTMKRLRPIINAFGTICIFLIVIIIISWNGWNIYKSNFKKNNNEILKNNYKNKKIINFEYFLIFLYNQLNKKNIFEYRKNILRKKIIRFENLFLKYQKKIFLKKEKIINKNIKKEERNEFLKNKYFIFLKFWKLFLLLLIFFSFFGLLTGLYINNNIYDLVVANWNGYIDNEIIINFEKKYNVKIKYIVYDSNEALYNKLYTTNYDVMVPSDYMINKLASENKLEKIDYNKLNYNKNKTNFRIIKPNSLYSNLIINDNKKKNINKWFNYDNIDVNWYLKNDILFYNNCINKKNPDNICFDFKKTALFNNGLLKIMNQNKINNNNTISDYSIPLYWGDIVLVINPKLENIFFIKNILYNKNKELPKTINKYYDIYEKKWNNNRKEYLINDVEINGTYSNGISWEILWKAAESGKKVILNNDYKNLFMIANQIMYQKNLPTNIDQANIVFNKLKKLIKISNVSLMNDEIINTVKDGRFDFALMYNGDAIYSDFGDENGLGGFGSSKIKSSNYKLIIITPRNGKYNKFQNKFIDIEGTNIWTDNMVISKNSNKKMLAYNFINYIIFNQNKLTNKTKYTSPYQQVINYELNNYCKFKNNLNNNEIKLFLIFYSKEYIPVSKKNNNCLNINDNLYISDPIKSDGPFFSNNLDKKLVNFYNLLLSIKN